MIIIRLITNERILMLLVFTFVFYWYNIKVYDLIDSVQTNYIILAIHIICISVLSYLFTMGVVFITLVFIYTKLKSINTSLNSTSYTFFNQLEALAITIDMFVDTINTVEEFNIKFYNGLKNQDNF